MGAYQKRREIVTGVVALPFFAFLLYSLLSTLSSPALAQRPSPEARKASLPTLPKGG